MKYWINTLPKDHVMIGKKEGIVQADQGKPDPLKRLKAGDKILFYSPKTAAVNGSPLKAFTAAAKIIDEKIDRIQLSADFKPFRLAAEFEDCSEVPIEPLIARLQFIHNKKSWGYLFQFGLFEIGENDFFLIYSKMKGNGCGISRRTLLAPVLKE